jgi:hypothetical protein
VSVSDRSSEGIDEFDLFILKPKNISWVQSITTETVPSDLAKIVRTSEIIETSPERRHFVISLLNSGKAVTFLLSGFSVDPSLQTSESISAFVEKKDWTQRSAQDAEVQDNLKRTLGTKIVDATLAQLVLAVTIAFFLAFLVGGVLVIYYQFTRRTLFRLANDKDLSPGLKSSLRVFGLFFGLPVASSKQQNLEGKDGNAT